LIVFQSQPLRVLYATLLILFVAGELALIIRRRARQGRVAADRGFFGLALLTLWASNLLAVTCLRLFPAAAFGSPLTSEVGLALLLSGILLRWWSIKQLGRFFTLDVAIAADQRVVETGPYKFIRHPSYTGFLLVIAGIGLCFGNAASLVVLVLPVVILLTRRIPLEEAALSSGLGEAYRSYMKRTKRLIPGVY
jgi:protein-S-isoprenylcysteine O-methyltransferase